MRHQNKQNAQSALFALLKPTNNRRRACELKHVGFRPTQEVREMLKLALRDHPNISQIVNGCLQKALTDAGYGNGKRAQTADGVKE
jgi:hypothetical protein